MSDISTYQTKIKIAAYTGGKNVPSARFRVRQYIKHLTALGIDITEFPSVFGKYPPANTYIRPFWAASEIISRFHSVLKSHHYDITLMQREMLSTYVTLEHLTKKPRVFDVDDAIWLHKRGDFAKRIAKICDGVICGNSFLADQFSKWNTNIIVIPTAIDINKFAFKPRIDNQIIGWSGTSGGFKYLYQIEPAIKQVLDKYKNVTFRVISDARPFFVSIPAGRIEYIKWSDEVEAKAIQDISIGIMPLDNSIWELGKCSFKMLTYMSCGKPVVVSPVGMNNEILAMGQFGYGANTIDEWVDALSVLIENSSLRNSMGFEGRICVESNYSIKVLAPKLSAALLSFL